MDEKRWLTINEQIAHLRARGVQFEKMDEAAAREQLQQENNFFRLTAYRKKLSQASRRPSAGAVCAAGCGLSGGSGGD